MLLRLIKRASGVNNKNTLRAGGLKLDLANKEVVRDEQVIKLSRKEYEVLECLMLSKGRVVSKERLLEQVWELGYETQSNTLEVHIKSLRDKADRPFNKKLIRTVYGFGYKIDVGKKTT